MGRDERRAAIAAATLPLLRVYGSQVTTRQIAEAAGVAEGTIFRAFSDKQELIHETIDLAFDPSQIEDFTAGLSAKAPLAERVEAIAEFLLERNRSMVDLMRGLHLALKDKAARSGVPPGRGHATRPHMRAEYFRRSVDAIATALTLSDEPWTVEPAQAAELLVAMAIAAGVSTPWLGASAEIPASTIARVLLTGALAPPSTPNQTSSTMETPSCS